MHPERRTVIDSIPVDNLPPHPLSVKIYGKPKPSEELLASIAEVGLLQPLIANNYGDGSYELLVGNTRAEAWRILLKQGKIKTKWIPCRFVRLSLFAIYFAQPKNGCGRQLPIIVEPAYHCFISRNRGRIIMIGFLLEQAFLQDGRQIVGRRKHAVN